MIKNIIFLVFLVLNFQYSFAQITDSIAIYLATDAFIQANVEDRLKLKKKIIQLNPDFNYVFSHLKQGKRYPKNVPKGFFEHNFKNDRGIEHPNLVFIPYMYNPKEKHQVRIFLHGAVSSYNMRQIFSSINRIDTSWNSVNTISLFPASWTLSKWWSYSQYENISKLLRFIKENYNVDENDVYLTGISDGGTGTYYLSNFYQTPFSCYLPFIGSMETLIYKRDKQFYLKNYQGLSFLVVNCLKDQIFNIDYVAPSVNELIKVAQEVKFYVVDSSNHSMRWYPVLKDTIMNFIYRHKRNPFPDKIYYATEKPDTFGRKFWVKIDEIGKTKNGTTIEDLNQIIINTKPDTLFQRTKFFGQIEINKLGNKVFIKTQNIKKYTLLISPDHFDLSKPIEVYTNGLLSFEGVLPKELKTLLNYYIEDNDRSMLFSNEINITVGKVFKR